MQMPFCDSFWPHARKEEGLLVLYPEVRESLVILHKIVGSMNSGDGNTSLLLAWYSLAGQAYDNSNLRPSKNVFYYSSSLVILSF